MKDFDYAVVDIGDEFVLFAGTYAECVQVLDESYGGTAIVDFYDVMEWPIESFSVDILKVTTGNDSVTFFDDDISQFIVAFEAAMDAFYRKGEDVYV
jgi:hypothetical protein